MKLHIHIFPDPLATPIVFPDTAERDGRYSEGSHSKFSELYVIHTPSGLKAPPWYRGFWGSVTLGVIFKADGASIVIVPISVRRYKPVVSNDILKSYLPISSVCRHLPLLVSQILTVVSCDADASRAESYEKATELTQSLWPSSVCRQALHLSPIVGFIVIHLGSSFLKWRLIRLLVGLKISAEVYTWRGLISIPCLWYMRNRQASWISLSSIGAFALS